MAEDNGSPSPGGGGAKRPSLMGRAAAPRPQADFQASILEVLDPSRSIAPPRRSAQRRLWPWMLGGAAAVLALTGWALHRQAADAAAAPEFVAVKPAASAPAAAASAAPAPVAVADAMAAAASQATPARIEDVAVPAAPVAASDAAPTPQPAERPTVVAAAAASASAAATSTATSPARTRPAAHAGVHRNPAHRAAAPTSPVTASARPTAKTDGIGARTAGSDPDVEIIAALMSHLDATAGATTPARTPETIAELVRSCRALAPAEASACQRRICQGYWGKAEACPARDRHTAND